MKPVRWGVLGAANFAKNHMAPAIHMAEGAELAALATSDPAKAAGFRTFCPALRVHASYEALLDDPEIDAVYIPLPNHLHVEWTLKALAAGGMVGSQRGARGGYHLVRALSDIPVADVITAIDGPIALTACVDGSSGGCESQGLCPMRGRWDPVNDAIHQALNGITLADMQEAAIPRAFRVPVTVPVTLAAASPAAE